MYVTVLLIYLKIIKKLSLQYKGHKTNTFFFFFLPLPQETDKRVKHHNFLKAIYLRITPNFVIQQQYRTAEQPRISQTSFLSHHFFSEIHVSRL